MNRKARRAQGKEARTAETIQQKNAVMPSVPVDAALDILLKQANAHYTAKNYEEAYKACLTILDRYPYQAGTLALLGLIFSDTGKPAKAEAFFRESLSRDPDNVQTLLYYGYALDRWGQMEEAIRFYRKVLALRPDHIPAHTHLGLILQKTGNYLEALPHVRKILVHSPEVDQCWLNYAAVLRAVYPALQPALLAEDEALHPLVTRCIYQSQVARNGMVVVGLELVLHTAAFSHLFDLTIRNNGTELAQAVNEGTFARVLCTPLMEALLTQHILISERMERVLAAVRRTILFLTCERRLGAEVIASHLPLMNVLAQQCCLNEYVYNETPEETVAIETLARTLDEIPFDDKPGPQACWDLLVYACYRPLTMLQHAGRIEETVQKNAIAILKEIVERAITAPRFELRLKREIPALDGDEGETSQQVQSMYEANPYPRWHVLEKRHYRTLRDVIRADLSSLSEEKLPPANDAPQVLIAGCGTGKQALWASHYTRADVLAIDLSRSSLAYALHKTRELGIQNIHYMQADIMNLAQLGRTFDVIECTGVLHHMQDPMAGWRVLNSLLAPGGMMKIALYSRRGRQSITAARAYIAERGYPPTLEGIRSCRQDIMNGALGKWTEALLNFTDFYSASECRDLLFHIVEHIYTLPQIGEMIDALRLEFLGIKPTGGQYYTRIYEDMFPQDKTKMSIAHWDALEQIFPMAFSGMFQFWVKKS